MSMQDPVADMLTQIRNGQMAKHKNVSMNSSNIKEAIVKVLKSEGYVEDFNVEVTDNNIKKLNVSLKYYKDKPVIEKIKRVSRPGLRVYKSIKELKNVPGFGIAVLSTSKGVMTHHEAKQMGVGGEVVCEVA